MTDSFEDSMTRNRGHTKPMNLELWHQRLCVRCSCSQLLFSKPDFQQRIVKFPSSSLFLLRLLNANRFNYIDGDLIWWTNWIIRKLDNSFLKIRFGKQELRTRTADTQPLMPKLKVHWLCMPSIWYHWIFERVRHWIFCLFFSLFLHYSLDIFSWT